MPKRSKSAIAALAGMVLLVTGFALSPAYAVPDYPTAAEVAAAKRNVEEKKKMIARIEGILTTLQGEADALEAVALQKNEQYNQAKHAVKTMADKVEGLEAKVKTAEEEAGEAKTMLGQIVARMYRQGTSGNTTLEIFFNPESSDELLYQLGASDVVAQRTQVMYEQAMQKQSDAKALASELSSAQAELETRKTEAEKLYREAKSAADAVIAKVTESESQRANMLGQLASLKDTASDLERQRIEGLEAERRQNARSIADLFAREAGRFVAVSAGDALETTMAALVAAVQATDPAVTPASVAQHTLAWLGPCIGPEAFEVGPEVREAFVAQQPAAHRAFVPVGGGKFLANLPALARGRLAAMGVTQVAGNDGTADWCTATQTSRFFSHRRDAALLGSTGRMAACVWLV